MRASEYYGIPSPPKPPSNIDQQLVRFIVPVSEKHPSGFCGRCLLGREDGYGNSGATIQKKGWVTRGSFGIRFGRRKPIYHYFLTDSGKKAALEAQKRIADYKRKRDAWSALFKEARERKTQEREAASAMSAGTAETRSGSGLQPASAVAKPDAQTPSREASSKARDQGK